jgi:hypothetical protein
MWKVCLILQEAYFKLSSIVGVQSKVHEIVNIDEGSCNCGKW